MARLAGEMTGAARILALGIGLLPYLGTAGIDTWMHERKRKVPRLEQAFHAALAITFTAFAIYVFLGRNVPAIAWLAAFIVCLFFDELGYHRGLAPSERRVHVISWGALLLFVAVWFWTEQTG
jgi:hypothetical protein